MTLYTVNSNAFRAVLFAPVGSAPSAIDCDPPSLADRAQVKAALEDKYVKSSGAVVQLPDGSRWRIASVGQPQTPGASFKLNLSKSASGKSSTRWLAAERVEALNAETISFVVLGGAGSIHFSVARLSAQAG